MEEMQSSAVADNDFHVEPTTGAIVLGVEQYPIIRPKFIRGNDDEGGEGNK